MKPDLRICHNCKKTKPISEFRDKRFGASKPPRSPYCQPCKIDRRQKPEVFLKELLQCIRYSDKRADIDDDVTVEFLLGLLAAQQGRCALSGDELTFKKTNKQYKKTMTNASIDRINSGIHYTKDNIRLVTAQVNYMKHAMTDDEFYRLCQAINSGRPSS